MTSDVGPLHWLTLFSCATSVNRGRHLQQQGPITELLSIQTATALPLFRNFTLSLVKNFDSQFVL